MANHPLSLTFFVDRDPEYFKCVINYLCTRKINQISKNINLEGKALKSEHGINYGHDDFSIRGILRRMLKVS